MAAQPGVNSGNGDTVPAAGPDAQAFTVRGPSSDCWPRLAQADAWHAALAFVNGECTVEGDLVAAVQAWSRIPRRPTAASTLFGLLARMRLERWWQPRGRARRNVEFHYDRSNEFYRTFLDRRLVYSCAYFRTPADTLDDAQAAKLDLVCRKLDLVPGDRVLDVGCGWGALVIWAAERYGARVTGCTLSRRQHEVAVQLIGERGLSARAEVLHCDYRDVTGTFDKMASVGMVEHVGRSRLGAYFRTLAARLDAGGLLLNHGIHRPVGVRDDAATWFLQRRVFPGGELARLEDTIGAAERAGFEVLDVENLRPHYALTCRAWVARLQASRNVCLTLVDAVTYRTWLLYLAASAVSFEAGTTDVYQVLLAKRPAMRRPLTRDYLYRRAAA